MSVSVAPGRWPLLGHTPAMLRRRFRFTSELYRYGDVVKVYLGPLPTYFVTSPELVHRVLVNDGGSFRKGMMFDKFVPYLGNGLLLSNGTFHLRQRRLMQPAFHRERIAGYAKTMVRAVSELVSPWRSGEVRAVDKDMQGIAVSIVGETLFSTEVGQRATVEARRSIPIVIKQGMVRALSPSFVERLPIPGNRRFDEAIERMRSMVLDVVSEWRSEGADRGDLLSMLLLARDEETGEHMTDDQICDEVLSLFTGAVETTALALAWAFHEIARHPEVEQRLHAELDRVLSGRLITFDDLPKLTFTQQVVNEVLRMYPVWILMRRATAEVQLAGERIPAGSEVTVSPHALHFDSRFYDNPHRFDPDRWQLERVRQLPKGAFIPFGAGNRQCIGNSFAQTEILIVLATIAARWRLVPVPARPVRVKFTSAAYPSRMPMTVVPRG
ncbi:MAG: cytochrome P450 [Kutzneria sp.]|nr:cytochrome P450 [Kutzneria sp.]